MYAHAKGTSQVIPWPYSFVAALESGRTSWTAMLDAIRLGPEDEATAVTAARLREAAQRPLEAGQWRSEDGDILIVADA
ncbi:transposase [Nonomuraea purpurea]|uniref:Transposase n=1 Tax=Nonomuraea purpurea TaxID=1849276 RepID=A0ABV8GCA7_9ACTN